MAEQPLDLPIEVVALNAAIEIAGGVSKLADSLETNQSVVSNWRLRKKVPPSRCIPIEEVTNGAVTRHDLRPDIFGPKPDGFQPNRAA